MKIVSEIMKENPCYKAGKKIKVKGLMLHSVGCPQPDAATFIKAGTGQNIKERVYMHLLMEITGQCTRRCRGITEDGIVEELEIMNI